MQVRKGATVGGKLYSAMQLPPDHNIIGTELHLPSGKGADAADTIASHLEGPRFQFLFLFLLA